MNYGYAPLNGQLALMEESVDDEANRYGLALYHHVASTVDLTVDLSDKEVLEVGCGRGGGAAFIQRYFKPRSMTGVDFAEKAVAICHSQYATDGIRFATADAEQIPFAPKSFDVVINVESSHCYPNVERFLQEVKRVLRPQGYFLFADFRPRKAVDLLRHQIHQCGLVLLQEEVITGNVVRALDLDTERRLALSQQYIPSPLRKIFNDFAGVRGSQAYQEFQAGQTEYLCFALKKE
jgi:ubiquinone/menaquinone biosynthesis C-methylase UbiE